MTISERPLAVITGANSGIGLEFARRYAKEGFDLLLVARNQATLSRVADELKDAHGITATTRVADLSNATEVEALAELITDKLPRVDHLVNCAGVAPGGDLDRTSAAELERMIATNINAVTLLTRAAVIRMRAASRGTIVNIASASGYQPMPHFAAYAASKSYILRFTEAMSAEQRPYGLRIFSVGPGDTETPMNPGPGRGKRTARQVVDTAFATMPTKKASVVDGRRNAFATLVTNRLLPKQIALNITERMMRRKNEPKV